MSRHRACHACGRIHVLPELRRGEEGRCTRCGAVLERPDHGARSLLRTVSFALAGLVLYLPAVSLPMLAVERFGHRHASSLLTGSVELIRDGSWFVGVVIVVFSILLPLAKLLLLLVLGSGRLLGRTQQAWTYRWLEHLGRWGMLDVLLVALLVALVKLGDLVRFEVGLGVWFFVPCVAMSVFASASFNPRSIWNERR